MAERTMSIRYDEVGDILLVDLVPRHADQESDMIDDLIVARFNKTTGKVENFDVLFFRKELERGTRIELPLDAVLEPEPDPVPGS